MVKKVTAFLVALLSLSAVVHAQVYPDKLIKIVVPYTPGGSVDQVAREVAARLKDRLGQTVLVENRAGASANIGADYVAKAPADGYTLLMSAATTLAAAPSIFKNLPYDPRNDLVPVVLIAAQPNVLVVNPNVKVKSVAEFIALAKADPGKLSYAIASVGGPQHMSAELFMMMTGTKLTQVPYKGGANAVTDLLGGQVDAMFGAIPEVVQFIHAGRLRPLAVTTKGRTSLLPDLPSLDESGLKGYELVGWIGLAAPAKTPAAVTARINSAVNEIIADPAFKKRLGEMGLGAQGGSVSDFKVFVDQEVVKYKRLVEVSGMQPM